MIGEILISTVNISCFSVLSCNVCIGGVCLVFSSIFQGKFSSFINTSPPSLYQSNFDKRLPRSLDSAIPNFVFNASFNKTTRSLLSTIAKPSLSTSSAERTRSGTTELGSNSLNALLKNSQYPINPKINTNNIIAEKERLLNILLQRLPTGTKLTSSVPQRPLFPCIGTCI